MNDPATSSPPTYPPTRQPPPAAGTRHDPHGTLDYPTVNPSDTMAAMPQVPSFLMEKELARGGMGVVYQARDTALNRTIAIKVLQDRFPADSAVAARFLEEAQITAQLQHPGIPPIYEVGTLGEGDRPFLAMKLIMGETLEAKLQRGDKVNHLALTEAIAQAVGYAHAHGVIHRDLKPQNIMVGPFGEVQVMDWGLAKKLRQGEETDDSVALSGCLLVSPSPCPEHRTETGAVLGTPAYMAPEQAAGEIDKVDARSDVFGLGSVLCCMLTGQPPYAGTEAESVRLHAVRGQTDAAFARLDGCGAEPEAITLCKRCLAFAPKDRPSDGNAVAQEVAALRAAAEERAKRAEIDRARAEVRVAEQHKRRQVWLGLAVTLLVGLLASMGLAAWALHAQKLAEQNEQQAQEHARQARTESDLKEAQRQRADAERKEAITQRELADAVKDFLQHDVLQLADPVTQQEDRLVKQPFDANTRLQEVILRAARSIEGKFPTQPLVEAELRLTIGFALYGMGRYDLAAQHYSRARDLFTQVLGPDDPRTLTLAFNLANAQSARGLLADALNLYADTQRRLQKTLGPRHRVTLRCGYSIAGIYFELGRHAEALAGLKEILALQTSVLGSHHPDTLNTMYTLGTFYADRQQYDQAVPMLKDTLKRQQATLGRNHPFTLQNMHSLAATYFEMGQHADALTLFEETLPLMKTTHGPEHPHTLATMNWLGITYKALGRRDDALKVYREASAAHERRAAVDPQDLDNLEALGGVQCNIGNVLQDDFQFASSLTAYGRALVHLHAVVKQQPQSAKARQYLCETYSGRANIYEAMSRYAEADADWDRLIELTPAAEKAKRILQRDQAKALR